MPRIQDKGTGLEIRLTPRRVKIKPNAKRHQYIRRLEKLVTKHETIINDPETPETIQIRPANTLSRLIATAYTMVNDYHIEQIEQKLKELEETQKKIEENTHTPYP